MDTPIMQIGGGVGGALVISPRLRRESPLAFDTLTLRR